jgi:hypothetical protein
MDSVYDAAKTHAEKLKAELTALQTYLDLHDRFREHFGLAPSKLSATVPKAAETAVVEQTAAPPEVLVQEAQVEEPIAEAEAGDAAEGPTLELKASKSEASEPEASEPDAAAAEAREQDAPLEVEAKAPAAPSVEAAVEDAPRVIKASEGVLIAAAPEAGAKAEAETEVEAPLGPEATLQSVAEKLAATIGAAHPSVTGYTV